MRSLPRFLRTTLAGGILFLLPAVVLIILVSKAVEIADKIAGPLAEHLPVESPIGLKAPMLLAIGLLILFCFAAGVFARTTIAQRATSWVESAALSNLPGYSFVKAVSQGLLAPEKQPEFTVVLARFGDRWQNAFLVERLDDGHVAVFVPGVPNPQSGSLYFMSEDSIKTTDVSFNSAIKCLTSYGKGSKALFGGRLGAAGQETVMA